MPVLDRIVENELQTKPELLVIIANAPDTARITQLVKSQRNEIPIFASEWSAFNTLIELGGRYVEGVEHLQFFNRGSTELRYKKFKERYLKRFRLDVEFATVAAYDAASLAMRAHGIDSHGSLKQKILSLSPFKGLQSTIILDKFGDSKREVHLTSIENGRFVQLSWP